MAKNMHDFIDEVFAKKRKNPIKPTRKGKPVKKAAPKRKAAGRASQITGKPPSPRLKARRKAATMPGYWPNPVKMPPAEKYYCVDQQQGQTWYQIGIFFFRSQANEYAQAIFKRSPTHSVRVLHRVPGANNRKPV